MHVPNEFGFDSRAVALDSPLRYKPKIRAWLRENGQPALHVVVGVLFETYFVPQASFDPAAKTFRYVGSPDTYYSFSTTHDIGTYLGSLLTAESSESLSSWATSASTAIGSGLAMSPLSMSSRTLAPSSR